jgi:hypothetical protein
MGLRLTGGILKMNKRYGIGNAQTIGHRKVQSNYFSTEFNEAGNLLAVMADGAIDHPNGRRAAIMAVTHCINAFLRNALDEHSDDFMLETAIKVNRQIQDAIYLGKSPCLSLTALLFIGEDMHYFNVGVNKIFLYDGINERKIGGSSFNDAYSSGKVKLQAKNIISVTSAGVHTDTHPMERLKAIESTKEVFDKAQALIKLVEEKNLDNQLNATALLIETIKRKRNFIKIIINKLTNP